uniref:transglycosylase family protein n=1 Tax=Streptomyces sp. NRRL F-5123 TaxID=1463856 RepID=UPI0018FF5519
MARTPNSRAALRSLCTPGRRLASVVLTAATLAMPLLATSSAHAASVATWDKVAQCESSGNWAANTGNGYYGGLQFSKSTWDEFGGRIYAVYPHQATKEQQIRIGEKVLATQGENAWPDCGHKSGLGSDDTVPYPPEPTLNYAQTTSADFNGDGQADIIAQDSALNLKMWTHNPGGYFNAAK